MSESEAFRNAFLELQTPHWPFMTRCILLL
jgi:hypothetical protein